MKSFPKPDVIWFRNDVRLRGDAYVKLQPVNDEYNVIVRNLKLTDSGVYRCEASTSAGTASKEFKVEIKGKMLNALVRCTVVIMCSYPISNFIIKPELFRNHSGLTIILKWN